MADNADIAKLMDILENERPMHWEDLPDIELYMDQLLIYVNRQQPFGGGENDLTKSMVNNYIKQGIIARPNGKRYTREHVTSLSMLNLLKEVLPINVCKTLFELIGVQEHARESYDNFRENLDWCMQKIAYTLDKEKDASLENKIMMLALFSFATRRAAITLLMQAGKDAEDEPKDDEA